MANYSRYSFDDDARRSRENPARSIGSCAANSSASTHRIRPAVDRWTRADHAQRHPRRNNQTPLTSHKLAEEMYSRNRPPGGSPGAGGAGPGPEASTDCGTTERGARAARRTTTSSTPSTK